MANSEKAVAVPDGLGELVERLVNARRRSDELFDIVRPDSLYERPIPERHRIIFYLGHLEAFDWNLLAGNCFSLKSAHSEMDRLFAFGIDPVGGELPADTQNDWPTVPVVRGYISQVRTSLDQALERLNCESITARQDGFSLSTLLNVAIEHRLMHVETLAYMLHQLPLNQKVWRQERVEHGGLQVEHEMVTVPFGLVTLGMPRNSEIFGWDNEFEAQEVEVPAFEMDRYKVTNLQFLQFIADGGYEDRAFWKDDDWAWRVEHQISHPSFWKRNGEQWLWRTMFSEVPLPLDWPVYVSHAEASAYARWAGKSLPSEAQWQRAAYGSVQGEPRVYPWGSTPPNESHGNFDFSRWAPASVNSFSAGQSAFGAQNMSGNGWEWTSTVFGPFPGFEPFPFYPGYSADFFDGRHLVVKGGSPRTAACLLRPTFRNWFQPHYQYVYAGFRCVSQ